MPLARIGADGFYALKVMRETNAAADDVTDDEIRDAIKLLAETEGIFAETAGVTVGVAKKLIASSRFEGFASAVICVTGNGLKTLDAVQGHSRQTARNRAEPARIRGAAGA